MTEQIVRDVPQTLAVLPNTIYGPTGLFPICTDQDLMSLSYGSQNELLDWFGWEGTNTHLIQKNFITWVRPEASAGARTAGYLADPCGDSNGVDWGYADFVLKGFGRLRRHGPTRDATKINEKYCEIQPRYRLDGTPITDDDEYDMRITMESMMQDLKEMVVSGSSLTGGQFDGLERLVKTGYTTSTGKNADIMDSIVINWNANLLTATTTSGVTWNGAAVGTSYKFVDVLLYAFRRLIDRIRFAPSLRTSPIQVGDIVFVAPSHIIRQLLDAYTFWSIQPGVAYNEVNLQNYEARTFRNNLNGGMFGAGRIWIDGFEIPMMAYDWGLVKGPTLSDAYILTRGVGNLKIWQGQYLDMRSVPSTYPESQYSYTDGGRLLTWLERDGTCNRRQVEMQPRLFCMAPWAQIRIQNIKATGIPGGIISPDPWETSFFPESSFVRARAGR